MTPLARLRVLSILVALAAACSAADMGPWNGESDADADSDADSDADTDADIDGDGDADGDYTPNVTEEPGLDDSMIDMCENGGDDDEDGLVDCADFGCMNAPRCCAPVAWSWVQGNFTDCSDLGACGWATFAGAADVRAVELSDGVVLLGGDGVGEVGLYSDAVAGLTGEPTLAFVASLSEPTCGEEECRQALGVALARGQAPSAGTGVVPEVGLLLDGELAAVHLFVGGRLDATVPLGIDALTEPHGYALRVESDGTLSFWVEAAPEILWDLGALAAAEAIPSRASVSVDATGLRVVAFGRLTGEAAARLGGIRLERRVCDVPDDWRRPYRGPVHTSAEPAGRAGRPAVALTDAGYVMVYEGEGHLEVATSADGEAWESQGRILTGTPPTQYGRVAQRAPTILYRRAEGEPAFHLWFEGVAEVGSGTMPGVTPTAILHATSSNGLEWVEPAEGSVAISGVTDADGGRTPEWRYEVHQPAVAALDDGLLAMWFVGRNPMTGATAIGVQTSVDGESWTPRDVPVSFEPAETAAFERDGVANPAVVFRDGVLHMWYEGESASRSAIGYAVAVDIDRWQRFGAVLEPAEPWEGRRVGGPAVVVRRPEGSPLDELSLWYHAGSVGREQVGLAYRDAPPLPDGP